MRIRFGRPDLGAHAARFDVPAAAGPFGVTFLGVSGLLVSDGTDAVMTDGFFSRPSLPRVALGRIAPDPVRIDAALARLDLSPRQDGQGRQDGPRLHAVAAVHTHYDHVMDSPSVALRTGAVLAGGVSAAQVGRGAGLAEDRIHLVTPGRPMRYGPFTLTFVLSEHCPPDRFPGAITGPVVPPVKAAAYRCGEAWSILLGHDDGRTALVQGSAGFRPGALDGHRADVAFLGVGGLGVLDADHLRGYWAHTVRAVGARRVVLTHWDDFFRSLDRPLRALPYAADDLDFSVRVLAGLAERDGVTLHLPTLWRREDPWA